MQIPYICNMKNFRKYTRDFYHFVLIQGKTIMYLDLMLFFFYRNKKKYAWCACYTTSLT